MDLNLVSEDEFAAFAADVEAKAQAAKNKSNTPFTPREYEEVKWVGLEQGSSKIIRIVGAPPTSLTSKAGNAYTAKEIYFSKVMSDDGKHRIQLKLPLHADDVRDEHIMWRIINKALEVEWVPNPAVPGKKMKKYKHDGKSWFEAIRHGNYKQDDPNYQWSKGWSGQQVVIMNVIDREDDWCSTNKHTKLLSKKVGTSINDKGETVEWPETGVPCYGFLNKLASIIATSGSWEKYDVAVTKTGEMTAPYGVENATAFVKSGMPELIGRLNGKDKYVSLANTLTPDELSYGRYDIAKMFAPTSYQKIQKSFGQTIKDMDADLGTHFTEELIRLADDEKAQWEAARDEANDAPTEESSLPPASEVFTETKAEPTPTVSRVVSMALSADKISVLKGWANLSEQEKAQIKDVVLNDDGTLKEISYTEDAGVCVECNPNGCGFPAPKSWTHCPVCGAVYA